QRGLLGGREEAQRDLSHGGPGAAPGRARRDRLRARHRRPPHRRRRRQLAAPGRPRLPRHHPLPAAPELHRAGRRPRSRRRPHRALRRQGARPRARGPGLRLARGRGARGRRGAGGGLTAMAATATRAALAVTPEVEETAAWLAEFAQRATRPPTSEPAAIADLREEAIERFRELGFPTTRQEAWRATNVAAIARGEFRSPAAPARGEEREDDLQAAQPWIFPAAATLTFLDGHLISAEQPLQAGLVAMSLAQALAERPDEVAAHLGRHASFENHSFVALNTALWQDGAYVRLAPGTVVREPIHLLFLSTGNPVAGAAPVTFPRNLLVIGESAQATVVETYAALDGPETPETKGRYFTCAVTELVAGPNSAVDHYKVQRESLGAFHLATFEVWQDRSSTLSSHSIALGGALVRNDVNATLHGEGIDTHLNGLYVVGGTQFVDNHMRVEHAKPHCASHELYKG